MYSAAILAVLASERISKVALACGNLGRFLFQLMPFSGSQTETDDGIILSSQPGTRFVSTHCAPLYRFTAKCPTITFQPSTKAAE